MNMLSIFLLFQDPPCEDDVLPFLEYFQSTYLGSESNAINYFDQYVALGNNHYDYDKSIYICDHEFLGASFDFMVPPEGVDMTKLDLESDPAKKFLIETSSSSHYPSFSIVFDASTFDGDTPFSSSYSSDQLTFQLTQCVEIIHDEN